MPKDLLVYGLSHHSAPLELRERLAAEGDEADAELSTLMDQAGLSEGVLLSTCNRVELLATTREPQRAMERVREHFNRRAAPDRVDGMLYDHHGLDAVTHLFRVASGLDSQVLGEPQILGQVKDAYARAQQLGVVGSMLGRCFDRCFSVAKRVRTETEVASGNVSVSSIAVELAEKIFSDLASKRVLLVGAGEMSEQAARSLKARGASLAVVNRSAERGRALADAVGGEARPLEALATELKDADVVISSTSKEGFVITQELMLGVCKMRRWRQLFMIDIAVPRDIDPRVDSLRNVFLYDMDDLKRVSHANMVQRERAADAADAIIAEEVQQYERWLRTLELTPTIVALRARVRAVVLAERDRIRPRLGELGARESKALDAMCESIVNKLLHEPLTQLKKHHDGPDAPRVMETLQQLFGLELDEDAGPDGREDPTAAERELASAGGRRGRG